MEGDPYAYTREQDLVQQIVTYGWRLKRLFKAEPQAWTRAFIALEKIRAFSETTKLADALNHDPQFFPRLQRLIASVQRSYHQAAADLDSLQAARAKSAPANPSPETDNPGVFRDLHG